MAAYRNSILNCSMTMVKKKKKEKTVWPFATFLKVASINTKMGAKTKVQYKPKHFIKFMKFQQYSTKKGEHATKVSTFALMRLVVHLQIHRKYSCVLQKETHTLK